MSEFDGIIRTLENYSTGINNNNNDDNLDNDNIEQGLYKMRVADLINQSKDALNTLKMVEKELKNIKLMNQKKPEKPNAVKNVIQGFSTNRNIIDKKFLASPQPTTDMTVYDQTPWTTTEYQSRKSRKCPYYLRMNSLQGGTADFVIPAVAIAGTFFIYPLTLFGIVGNESNQMTTDGTNILIAPNDLQSAYPVLENVGFYVITYDIVSLAPFPPGASVGYTIAGIAFSNNTPLPVGVTNASVAQVIDLPEDRGLDPSTTSMSFNFNQDGGVAGTPTYTIAQITIAIKRLDNTL